LGPLVAIYRSPSYSPLQHRVNDTAIMDATVARLEAQGWRAIKTTELEVEQGRLPAAPLYLNMCQGSLAAEQLMPLESDGAVVVNRLQARALESAATVGREVFGGDVPFAEPHRAVLIDITDWPSFAPFREDAAQAIAAYITHRIAHRTHA